MQRLLYHNAYGYRNAELKARGLVRTPHAAPFRPQQMYRLNRPARYDPVAND